MRSLLLVLVSVVPFLNCGRRAAEEAPPKLPPALRPRAGIRPGPVGPDHPRHAPHSPDTTGDPLSQEACRGAVESIVRCFSLPSLQGLVTICTNPTHMKQAHLRRLLQCSLDHPHDCSGMRYCLANATGVAKSP